MTNRRIELLSPLRAYEKKLLREFFEYDRASKLYAPRENDPFFAHRQAMLRMRRTFDVRHTHVQADGSECPCASARHADGQ